MSLYQKCARWLLAIGCVGMIAFACQKLEKEPQAESSQTSVSDRDGLMNPTITNGRAIFTTPAAFENYVLSLEGKKLDSLETSLGISSFRKFSNGNEVSEKLDDVFASVLNRDSMFQVGNDVFKLIFHEKKVFVLRNSPAESLIGSMKNATKTSEMPSNAISFYFWQNVLDELEPTNEPEGPFNTCADIDKQKDNDKDYCEGGDPDFDYNYKFHIKYRSAGVWKWLNLEFHHKCQGKCDDGTGSTGGYDNTNFDFKWSATWRRKGESLAGSSSVREYFTCPLAPITGCSLPESGTKFKKPFYHGIRCLTRYSLTAQARLLDRCDNTSIIQTDELEIKED